MKRVFQVSEITQLCKDIKSILEQCKEHVSAMRTYADQAGEALDAVPSEARYGIAVHDVSQLRKRTCRGNEKPPDTFGGNGTVFNRYPAYYGLLSIQKSL